MAASFNQNSQNITGWEITPFVPIPVLNETDVDHQEKEFSSTPILDSALQEENGVLEVAPVSVKWPENVVRPEQQWPLVDEQKTGRRRYLTSAKIVAISSVYFKFVRQTEGPMSHALALYNDDDESSAKVEDMASGVNEEGLLPFPGLLKEWKMETRERPNGVRDKFYSHPTSKRTFRSIIEVVDYITSKNMLETAEEHQGHKRVKLLESSSSNKNKRKNSGMQKESKLKMWRGFPGAHAKKTPQQLQLEEFYANAHNNLMNLSPATPEALEVENKSAMEPFLFDGQENLLRGLGNEGNGSTTQEINRNQSRKLIEEMQNGLHDVGSDIPENLQNLDPTNLELKNPQQNQNQGFEDKGKGNKNQDINELRSYQMIEEMLNERSVIGADIPENFQQGGINAELPNPNHQDENLDPPILAKMINELYQIGFGHHENRQCSEPPHLQQGGNM